MNELINAELSLMDNLLTERADHMHHYPDEFDELEFLIHSELQRKVTAEAKHRKLWWAMHR